MKTKNIVIKIILVVMGIVAVSFVILHMACIRLCQYHDFDAYKEWNNLSDKEMESGEYRAMIGGYIMNLEVKDKVGYRIEMDGFLYNREQYHSMMQEEAQICNEFPAYETSNYELSYFSVTEVEPFYVGLCIEDSAGNIIHSSIADINDRTPRGKIRLEEGKRYTYRVYCLLDTGVIENYENYTGERVPNEMYPTYINQRWDYMEMFVLK